MPKLGTKDRRIAGNTNTEGTGTNQLILTDSDGHLQVDVLSGASGGTQYAEDAGHTSGDTGTLALVVRKDTATQLAGTDEDYSVLITDASGRLHVNVGNDVDINDISKGTQTNDVKVTLDSEVVAVDATGQGDVPITLDGENVTVTATDLDIRDLTNASDSILVYGSDDGGTTKRVIKTDAGGAIQIDVESGSITADIEGDYDDDSGFTVGTDKGLAVGGVFTTDTIDAGDFGAFKISAKRELFVVQDTAADLNVTEASASDTKTAVQVIDDAYVAEASAATKGVQISLDNGTNSTFAQCDGSGNLKVVEQGTVTVSATDLDIRDLDVGQDDILIYANTAKDASGTSYVPLVDADGHLQIDVLSAPSTVVTATDLDIRDLTSASDSVEAFQDVHDSLVCNANVQQGDADVAIGNALYVRLTDGTNTMPTMDAVNRAGYQYITDGTLTVSLDTAVSDSDPNLDNTVLFGTHALLSARKDASTTIGLTCEDSTHNALHVAVTDGEGVMNVNASNQAEVSVENTPTIKPNALKISNNTSYNVDNTHVQVVDASSHANMVAVTIANNGDEDIYLENTTSVGSAQFIKKLASGESWEFPLGYTSDSTNDIYAERASAQANDDVLVIIWEEV